MNDVVLNKKQSIERCIRQIRIYYAQAGDVPFEDDHLRQDAIAINLQRACEQAIDLANYTIRKKKLGLPTESKESFRILAENKIIPRELSTALEKMVAFEKETAVQIVKSMRSTEIAEKGVYINLRVQIPEYSKHLIRIEKRLAQIKERKKSEAN